MTTTTTAMRLAFERASSNVPVQQRTRVYAMVRSALNRRVGTARPKTMWSVARGRRG